MRKPERSPADHTGKRSRRLAKWALWFVAAAAFLVLAGFVALWAIDSRSRPSWILSDTQEVHFCVTSFVDDGGKAGFPEYCYRWERRGVIHCERDPNVRSRQFVAYSYCTMTIEGQRRFPESKKWGNMAQPLATAHERIADNGV